MAASGQRFAFIWVDPNGVQQVATVERTGDLGGAPTITSPSVEPNFVIANAQTSSRVIANVAAPGSLFRVSHVAMLIGGDRSGLVDKRVDGKEMRDDGTSGDGAARDGTFASEGGWFFARGAAQLGLHAMRINAELDDGNGIRHATSLEFTPFSVIENGAPRIDAIEPDHGEGGDLVTIRGEYFDLSPTGAVLFGDETASVHAGSQQQLQVQVPYGIPPGPLYVTVRGRGLTSNAVLFNLGGGERCRPTVTPMDVSAEATEFTFSVEVEAGAGCTWKAQSNRPWIHLLSAAQGAGSGTVDFRVEANPSADPRWGRLAVAGKTVTVFEAGARPGGLVVGVYPAVEIRWYAEAGKTYQVYRSVGFPHDLFEPVGDPVVGTGDYASVFVSIRDSGYTFYTVEVIE